MGVATAAAFQWATLGALLVAVGAVLLLRERIARLEAALSAHAGPDALTGLATRQELEERLAAELERAIRAGRPLAILVIDLDWFKQFNDRFGRSAGDRALAQVAGALQRATRASDLVARLGGEEFAGLAPETDAREGLVLAERLRAEVGMSFARDPEGMTVSCGVASFPEHGVTAAELLHAADRALHDAKERGRDRSAVAREAAADELEGERPPLEEANRLTSLLSLAEAVDRRKGAPVNSRRVARYAAIIAGALDLPEEEIERIEVAALLRDIGEVGISESILAKAGPLTDEERAEVERHPEIGARIAGAAQLGRVGEWILTHHERPDGTGYPRGLSAGQTPIEARILAVADAYGAMTAKRPYRRAFSPQRARAELQARAGTQFDHEVVETFLSLDGDLGGDPSTRPAARSA